MKPGQGILPQGTGIWTAPPAARQGWREHSELTRVRVWPILRVIRRLAAGKDALWPKAPRLPQACV